MSPSLNFIPRDERFFEMFNRSAANNLEAAQRLVELMESCEDIDRKARRLKDIEHAGDEITHEVFAALARTFVTPIDREDIGSLAASLDDVVDYIEETARRVRLYKINQCTPIAKQFARIIQEQCEQIATAMPALAARKFGSDLHKTATEVHRLENEADDLLADAVATLYDGVTEVPQVISAIRWGDIYQLLEDATDRAEHVAVVLQNISLKNA
jgi:predicted phosphate transport protein (TIGR00153 family)